LYVLYVFMCLCTERQLTSGFSVSDAAGRTIH